MCSGEDAARVMHSRVGRGWWEGTGRLARSGVPSSPHPLRDQHQRGGASQREVPPAFRDRSRERSPPRGCQPYPRGGGEGAGGGGGGAPEATRSVLGAAATGGPWVVPHHRAPPPSQPLPPHQHGCGGGGIGCHGRAVPGARNHAWPVRRRARGHHWCTADGPPRRSDRAVCSPWVGPRSCWSTRPSQGMHVRGWGGHDLGWWRQGEVRA